jgi:hypothetical protein
LVDFYAVLLQNRLERENEIWLQATTGLTIGPKPRLVRRNYIYFELSRELRPDSCVNHKFRFFPSFRPGAHASALIELWLRKHRRRNGAWVVAAYWFRGSLGGV